MLVKGVREARILLFDEAFRYAWLGFCRKQGKHKVINIDLKKTNKTRICILQVMSTLITNSSRGDIINITQRLQMVIGEEVKGMRFWKNLARQDGQVQE